MRTVSLPNGMRVKALSSVDAALVYHEVFEQTTYIRHGISVADGATVFDVGANVGLFSLALGQAHQGLRLFLFEPVPAIFAALRENQDRHLSNADVRLFNVGLAARPGAATFMFSPGLSIVSTAYTTDTGGSVDREAPLSTWLRAALLDIARIKLLPPGLVWALLAMLGRSGTRAMAWAVLTLPVLWLAVHERLRRRRVRAPLETLSAVIAAEGLTQIDLLKIDVEGAELDVLLGITEHDWPKIRQVVIEVHDVDGRVKQVRQMLIEQGFRTVVDQEDWALHPLLGIFTVYAVREGDEGEPGAGQ